MRDKRSRPRWQLSKRSFWSIGGSGCDRLDCLSTAGQELSCFIRKNALGEGAATSKSRFGRLSCQLKLPTSDNFHWIQWYEPYQGWGVIVWAFMHHCDEMACPRVSRNLPKAPTSPNSSRLKLLRGGWKSERVHLEGINSRLIVRVSSSWATKMSSAAKCDERVANGAQNPALLGGEEGEIGWYEGRFVTMPVDSPHYMLSLLRHDMKGRNNAKFRGFLALSVTLIAAWALREGRWHPFPCSSWGHEGVDYAQWRPFACITRQYGSAIIWDSLSVEGFARLLQMLIIYWLFEFSVVEVLEGAGECTAAQSHAKSRPWAAKNHNSWMERVSSNSVIWYMSTIYSIPGSIWLT